MTPQVFETLVEWRQQQLLQEAAAERLAVQLQVHAPGLRGWMAGSLVQLATWLSAGVSDAMADARSGRAAIRAIATCDGVEYWRPTVPALPH
jgi:hypothetical protein